MLDVGYTGDEGIYELLNRSKNILQNVKYIREKNLIQEFLLYLAKDSNSITYGLNEVERAISLNLAEKILVSTYFENLEKIFFQCSTCGFNKELVINISGTYKILNETCPKCGTPLEIKYRNNLLDYVVEKAESNNIRVELISTETDEGEQLRKAFGGIAAILRYNLPER